MSAYEVIRDIHRIGSPIVGTVIDCTECAISHGIPVGHVSLATSSVFRGILQYQDISDDYSQFSPDLIPNVGDLIETVVLNFVDDTLYLSAKPHDLKTSTIEEWQEFYKYADSLAVGTVITGIVEKVAPFGLFVNIGSRYLGLIDIGHTLFNGGHPMPHGKSQWPQVGDQVRCIVGYFRLHNQQIGLRWVPDKSL